MTLLLTSLGAPLQYAVENGEFRFRSGSEVPAGASGAETFQFAILDHTSNLDLDDGIARIRFRINEPDSVVNVGLRNRGDFATYVFFASENGAGIEAFQGTPEARLIELDESLQLGVGEEWVLEAAAIDDRVSLKLWQADTPEPSTPQMVALDLLPVSCGENCEVFLGAGISNNFPHTAASYVDVSFLDVAYRTLTGWTEGDFSWNQSLDATDIDALSLAIRSGNNNLFYDLNSDSVVNSQDHAIWVDQLRNVFRGDTNLDGDVDFADFLTLSNAFGRAGGWADGDFSGDGQVLFEDFLVMSANFGQGVTVVSMSQSVPEPTSGNISCLCLLVLLTSRRKKGKANSVWI